MGMLDTMFSKAPAVKEFLCDSVLHAVAQLIACDDQVSSDIMNSSKLQS